MLKDTQYTPLEIKQGLKRNEYRAFEQFYDDYAAALYGVICRLVQNEQIAGVLLDEAFLEFHHSIRGYDRGTCTAFTWALRICQSKAKRFMDDSRLTSQ